MKNVLKENKAITLIALVITIIVLLILAGVTIASLMGENGLLERAKNAKEETERTTVIESVKIDILGEQIEITGDDIEKPQLQAILSSYFKDVPDMSEMDNQEILNIELTTLPKYGTHTIKVSELFNGNLKDAERIKTVLDLEEGDIVKYNSSIGNIDCLVLYDSEEDNYSETGVQIVSAQPLGENVELGNGTESDILSRDNNLFNIAQNSYNNSITTLNNKAETFRKKDNTDVTISARCLGTNVNGSAISHIQYSSAIPTISNQDYLKIQALSLNNLNTSYWLAQQYYYMPMNQGYYGVFIIKNGNIEASNLYGYTDYSYGDIASWSYSYKIRPVFKLKENVKIKSGTGVDVDPYILEL